MSFVDIYFEGKPPWLEHFTNKCKTWDGISLNKHAVKFYRDLVYEGKATLLELRNYIFIRQWQMLSKINKDADVVHRLLEFLFAVVNEVKILQVRDLLANFPSSVIVKQNMKLAS